MSRPQVLIIGCGSVGLLHGYHLSFAADITYLVRPGRRSAFIGPKKLYDYGTDQLRTFEGYRVIESTSEVAGEQFFCVFDTLDGKTARSDQGSATLRAVGDLIRNKKDTFVTFDALGVHMRDHYASCMDIPKSRILFGESMFSHPATNKISVPSTATASLVDQADLFYQAIPGGMGFVIANTNSTFGKAFAKVYDQNNMVKITLLPGFVGDILPTTAMPVTMAWYVDGFGSFSHLIANKPLWELLLKAQTEAMALFGWSGWLISFIFGSWATKKMNLDMESGVAPLNFSEFNAFHHGSKVVHQDIMLLEEYVAEGERQGKKMSALKELCRQVIEVQAASEGK